MKEYIKERVCNIAKYIIEHKCTLRQAAKVFNVSKSTVFNDVTERILVVNPQLHADLLKVLKYNKAQCHIRGGASTKKKYLKDQ